MTSRTLMALPILITGILVGWLLPGWAAEPKPAQASEGVHAGTVIATVGTSEVTVADVEATRPEEFVQLARQRHELLEQSASRAIQIRLVEVEAESRGTSPAELVDLEVDGRITEPSNSEVEDFYRKRGLESQGALGELSPQIEVYLAQQTRDARYTEFLNELGEKYSISYLLEPLRSNVESEGFPAKGADDAPITIVEFADFECPYCRQLIPSLDKVLEAYGDHVRFVYRQFPLNSIHPGAQKSAEASLCADDQGKFWEMHDALFADQSALDVASIKATAASLGLAQETFNSCLDSGAHAEAVASDAQAARALGLTGTPGLFINGRFLNGVQSPQSLAAILDDELERIGYAGTKPQLQPTRVSVASEGFPSKGPNDAPVTIVEFSDFQCPYCYQLIEALDQVSAAYRDEVRIVYRQFPLTNLHPNAQKAAEASLCAQEQGKFWLMHDAMFSDQLALDVAGLKQTARSLGLDAPAFDRCLDTAAFADAVEADLAAGREVGITGTPVLFINGRALTGVQRFEALARVIDDELARVKQ